MKQYLVIGLGRFGTSVAKTLYEAGENILGIDVSEELVQDRINNNILKNAIIGDASDGKILKDIGAENFDVAFVCIGGSRLTRRCRMKRRFLRWWSVPVQPGLNPSVST